MDVIERKLCSQDAVEKGVILFSLINETELSIEEQKTFLRNVV